MIVIIEGAERTGKTTVCKYFEDMGFVYIKDIHHVGDSFNVEISNESNFNSYVIDNRQDSLLNALIAYNKKGINVVVDRFHISELVYRQIYRWNAHLSGYPNSIDRMLEQLGATLILMDREVDDNYTIQYAENKKDVEKIVNYFRRYFDKSEITRKFKYDFSKTTPSEIYNATCNKVYTIEEEKSKASDDSVELKSTPQYDFYLASPFFNEEQKERERFICDALRYYGYSVYAPIEHGIVGLTASPEFLHDVFESNIDAISNSMNIVAITDGKDMGTLWEVGYAYALGLDIVYFAETIGDNPFNIMLSQSGSGIFKSRSSFLKACREHNFNIKEEVYNE